MRKMTGHFVSDSPSFLAGCWDMSEKCPVIFLKRGFQFRFFSGIFAEDDIFEVIKCLDYVVFLAFCRFCLSESLPMPWKCGLRWKSDSVWTVLPALFLPCSAGARKWRILGPSDCHCVSLSIGESSFA